MHTDARIPDNDSLIDGDICIIGAGAAGLSIALQWIDTPYKIILIEGGGFEYDDKVQELYNGNITGHHYYPMKSSRLHYFGGTTGHWGGMCSTLDEIDFQKREWVENSGWPIYPEDLSVYYPRVHPILDLGPNEWDVKYWLQQNQSFKEFPLDKNVIWNKMWQISPPTRFGSKYRDTIIKAKNIHLYTYANVTDIHTEDNLSEIKSVTIKNHADKKHTVKAKYFILACGAIQNARVLLASNKQIPAGLGNEHDLVGRYFMEHPELKTGELWLTTSEELQLYIREKREFNAELAIQPSIQKELKILNGTVSLKPLPIARKIKANIETWEKDDPRKSLLESEKNYGDANKRSFIQRITDHFTSAKNRKSYNSYELYTRIEQSPNPDSRVILSNEKDSLGVPRANLHWSLSPIDKRTVRKINELLGQEFGASGIGRVKLYEFLWDEKDTSMPDFTSGGWHHMGTTRMSNEPQKGVVDTNCKVHSIHNLYIAGSGCFPTSGAVNPTFTIVALSLRLSDHLKEKIKSSSLTV